MENSDQSLVKRISSYNQAVFKTLDENTFKGNLKIDCIFGVNRDKIQGQTMAAINKEEIVFYMKNMLVKYNVETKQYSILYQESNGDNGKVTKIKHFLFENKAILVVLKLINDLPYIGIYESQSIEKLYFYKIGNNENDQVIDFSFNDKKNLFYLLIYQSQTKKQILKVIEIQIYQKSKPKVLLQANIKKTGGNNENLSTVVVGIKPDEVYLYGKGYFRHWKLSFNEKVIKQSNYRNIQRSIKTEKIVDFFWLKDNLPQITKEWILAIVSQARIIFVKSNQLHKITEIPKESLFKGRKKQSTETTLERSLNQIYKMKFNFEEEEQSETQIKNNIYEEIKNDYINNKTQINSISLPWTNIHKEIKFCASSKQGKIFIYQLLPDLTVKILSEIPTQNKMTETKSICASPDGQLIIISDSQQNPFIINQSDCSSDLEVDLQHMWINGNCHNKKIVSISSPKLNKVIVTLDDDGFLKVWNICQKDRYLMIDASFKTKPLEADIHPCGFLIAVNFGLEIKIYAIVSLQLEEMVAIKTNDFCTSLMFSRNGAFLSTNEKNLIKIYEPFTLNSLGSIEPQSLRIEVKNFQISENGEYIVYQCCNKNVYRDIIQFSLPSKVKQQSGTSIFCHNQEQLYNCYYFDFGTIKNEINSTIIVENDIFVGFGTKKYMAIYKNYGQQLIAEFPVQNFIVNTVFGSKNMLFAGTNTGNVRCYNWPILQSHCLMEISTKNPAMVYLKPPVFNQFKVWMDNSSISIVHKVENRNQVIVGSATGELALLSLQMFRKNKLIHEQISGDRKKMINAMNGLRFVSIIESERVKKLIDKTQNDIVKIQYECGKEKQNKQKQLEVEELDKLKNLEKRRNFYTFERDEYIRKEFDELKKLKLEKQEKIQNLQSLKQSLNIKYRKNIDYEKNRIQNIKGFSDDQKLKHKNRIQKLIETHKNAIKSLKKGYIEKIKQIQANFQKEVAGNFKPKSLTQMCPIFVTNEENDEAILERQTRVRELEQKISDQNKVYTRLVFASQDAKKQDEEIQKQFQNYLQYYNEERFKNLALHSQVLKMQNQLLEKRQILNKKDEVIHLAYQQKYNYENYQQLKHGSLYKIEKVKEAVYDDYKKKERQLKSCFEELMKEIKKADEKKILISRLSQKLQILDQENKQIKQFQQISKQKLRELKKYLLLEGSTNDSNQKYLYQQQQQLLARIKWLNKRFNLTLLNEKKIIALKKNGINQIIKQNKTLLEECNQLREEGIEYQNQINHLNDKLLEANKIIELERKLKKQKSNVAEQTEQLEQIREMFREQLESVDSQFQIDQL